MEIYCEATINLTCSLILLIFFNMGINGVLLGTLISSLGYVLWVEVFYIFKYGLKVSMSVYIKLFSKYCFLLGFSYSNHCLHTIFNCL